MDLRADFQLAVGNTQQSIEVAATPPLLQTENASLAVTIESRQLVELPTLGRSFVSSMILSPGVTPILSGNIGNVVFGQSQTAARFSNRLAQTFPAARPSSRGSLKTALTSATDLRRRSVPAVGRSSPELPNRARI